MDAMSDLRQVPAGRVGSRSAYGARPVSVDIARGRTLRESPHADATNLIERTRALPPTDQQVADRLSLAHWPRGHQILVCGLAGGTGRTTIAGLIATVLAELPYAHLWPPYALVDAEPRTPALTARRWDDLDPAADEPTCTRSGAWTLHGPQSRRQRQDFSALVVDCPSGLPSDLCAVRDDPNASIVLVTRPDRTSLSDTADALVAMNDSGLVSRKRVTVLVNHGVGERDRGSRSAATVLGIRCAAVHSLPADPALGPSRVLPSGHDLPPRLRRPIARLCLHAGPTPSTAARSPHLTEFA